MWALFVAGMLATGEPFSEAQYEVDAAFGKLGELKPKMPAGMTGQADSRLWTWWRRARPSGA
ncbi:hypothetical protein [Paenirhodobacter sp.]|uniref:hypothetical protein n=1 Tax=Paenirhodobacter sp. TaxID=1965326 RepID=UPI003B41A47E